MATLCLIDVHKAYQSSETVRALDGISLSFGDKGFVSILGSSGCGKTTLLNVIGGLDRYDKGDLLIDGVSTEGYTDADWDAYQNQTIGFVFQGYNLISHLNVVQNVELALSFGAMGAKEKRKKAMDALRTVGLHKETKRRPAQLSGGQAQRVAIARALVNNPAIILADEPTGALDSGTGVRMMDILKEVSKDRLVIMVTHNAELAREYSDRMIELLDGEVVSDTRPVDMGKATEVNVGKQEHRTHVSMSPLAALKLSLENLLTKKSRTFFTSLAGGIGIIGVALVLALSSGLSAFMGGMQSDALSAYPISISTMEEDAPTGMKPDRIRYPSADVLYRDDENEYTMLHTNELTPEYLDLVADLENALPGKVNSIVYSYGVRMNLINLVPGQAANHSPIVTTGVEEEVGVMGMGSTYLQVMPGQTDFILAQYDLIGAGSRLPEAANEIVLVVDEYNQMDVDFFNKLGIHNGINEYALTDFVGKSIAKVLPNDVFYTQENGLYHAADAEEYPRLLESPEGMYLSVVGVMRPKANAAGYYFNEGVVCTQALMDWALEQAADSQVAQAQATVSYDVHTGLPFADADTQTKQLRHLGADTTPTAIDIFPSSFDANDAILAYLDAWNAGKPEAQQVIYTNNATTLTTVTGSLITTVYDSLIVFACISLIVSGLMIAINTYVSVVERTREIGILRSLGARKADVTRVFEAEALIIGFISGVIGVVISSLLTLPINAALAQTANIEGIATLNPLQVVLLMLGSMTLTLAAGFIPAKLAAKKDPVMALRAE